ncbi:MAG: alpha/beta hydrolase, partial [Kiritimatiellaeota bacterium]|nr:alpha/beta hydrolase [Kiritimatiellota bacterium]
MIEKAFFCAILAAQIALSGGCATTIVKDMDDKYAPALRFEYTDGEYLNYEKRGSGAIPLLLLHGFGSSLRNWDDVIEAIEARGDLKDEFTIYALDMKGAGFSSKPRDSRYTIADNAAILTEFIEKLDLRGAVLVGHSLGGGVALYATVEFLHETKYYPSELLLIDAACYPTDFPFFVSFLRIPVLNYLLLSGLPSEFIARRALSKIMAPGTSITPELVKRYAFFNALPGHNYALIQTATNIMPENVEELVSGYQDIYCRTVIIWGQNDKVLPLSLGKRLHNDIPDSELIILEGCGHNPPEERPAE